MVTADAFNAKITATVGILCAAFAIIQETAAARAGIAGSCAACLRALIILIAIGHVAAGAIAAAGIITIAGFTSFRTGIVTANTVDTKITFAISVRATGDAFVEVTAATAITG